MISTFNNQHSFLSNFHPSHIATRYGIFPTVEHLYQAAKTIDLDDKEKIRLAHSPGRAKRMGRQVNLRPDWEDVKISIMLRAVRLKFGQHEDLAQKLIDTGNSLLVEGNLWHDNEWGNCTCRRCIIIVGKNLLGKVLMQVRQEIREKV